MAENSKIEWTHHTFNPWRGCTRASAGCQNCYAETMSARNPKVLGTWGPKGERVIAAEPYWRQPHKWNRDAAAAGERRRVFCASLADVFEGPETTPQASWGAVQSARSRLFTIIGNTPSLDWLLLTKRPENVVYQLALAWFPGNLPPNVWVGTSIEDQPTADERIPHLLKIPAAVRFLSCEPLLGPVDLRLKQMHPDRPDDYLRWDYRPCPYGCNGAGCCGCDQLGTVQVGPGIHWCIVGGESGPGARPMHPAWARSLRDQCQASGVAFHFKQFGECVQAGQTSGVPVFRKVGKKAAGRVLDGRTWDEYPNEKELAP